MTIIPMSRGRKHDTDLDVPIVDLRLSDTERVNLHAIMKDMFAEDAMAKL